MKAFYSDFELYQNDKSKDNMMLVVNSHYPTSFDYSLKGKTVDQIRVKGIGQYGSDSKAYKDERQKGTTSLDMLVYYSSN